MKALTLHQPWATLIAAGVKTIETRSWRPPRSLIGHRIAVHAGKQIIKSRNGLGAGTWEMMNTLYGPDWSGKIPRGAVIATARLASARRVLALDLETGTAALDGAPARTVQADPYGDFSPGRWLWFLEHVQPCNPPVPVRGVQGLWNWGTGERKLPDEGEMTEKTPKWKNEREFHQERGGEKSLEPDYGGYNWNDLDDPGLTRDRLPAGSERYRVSHVEETGDWYAAGSYGEEVILLGRVPKDVPEEEVHSFFRDWPDHNGLGRPLSWFQGRIREFNRKLDEERARDA